MNRRMAVLMVEDSESDAALLIRTLERAGYQIRYERVDTEAQMRSALDSRTWDVVIADHSMPQFDAPSALKVLQQSGQDIPFIIVSGTIDDQRAVEIMRSGAHDYLMKDNLLRLVPAVERELCDAQVRLERKLAKESLEASEALLKAQFINSPDIILIMNRDNRILTINRVLAGFHTAEELIGADVIEVLPPSEHDAVRRELDKCWENGEIHEIEHKIDEEKWVRARLVPLKSAGVVNHLMVISTDITERRRLEEQLRQAHKMEAIGLLAGGIAHDFNNALAAILMHLGLLQSMPKLPQPMRASLMELEKETLRAGDLTRQLLTFSRRQAVELRPLDINKGLESLLKMLSRLLGENISIDIQAGENIPYIEADPGMMEQVVVNLCINARDAMPNGGTLSIRTSLVDIEEEAAKRHCESRGGRFVCLTVADSGCGMDSATMNRIFEPFFTTKEVGKGTGLGLASVYGIVRQHKGWIDVDSTVGKGSTFRVFFPATDRLVIAAADLKPSEPVRGGNECILLVEDEPSLRSLVSRILQQYGYRVTEASDGIEALSIWRQGHEEFDLLFTDMIMPGEMTGSDLARELREANKDLKVVISSGYGIDPASLAFFRETDISFLAKPYRIQELPAIVRKCLDRSEAVVGGPEYQGHATECLSEGNAT